MPEFVIDIKIDPNQAVAGATRANSALGSVKTKAIEVQSATAGMGDEMKGFAKSAESSLKLIKIASFIGALGQIGMLLSAAAAGWQALGDAFEWAFESQQLITAELDKQLKMMQEQSLHAMRMGERRYGGQYAGMSDEQKARAVKFDFMSADEQKAFVEQEKAAGRYLGLAAMLGQVDAKRQDIAKKTREAEAAAEKAARERDAFDLKAHNEWLKRQEEKLKAEEELAKYKSEAAKFVLSAELDRNAEDFKGMAEQAEDVQRKLEQLAEDIKSEYLKKEQEKADAVRNINQQLFGDLASLATSFVDSAERDIEKLMKAIIRAMVKAAAMRAALAIDPTGGLGGVAALGGGLVSSLFGFADGGSFRVGGTGGTDSQTVAFRASPDETVYVQKPGDPPPGGGSAPVNVRVINQVDPNDMLGVLDSPQGERIIWNVIGRQPNLLKRLTR